MSPTSPGSWPAIHAPAILQPDHPPSGGFRTMRKKERAPSLLSQPGALVVHVFGLLVQERAMGLEPTTSSLGSWHSTN